MIVPSLFVLLVGLVVGALLVSRCYRRVGPNEVLIISGRRSSYTHAATGAHVDHQFQVLHGGGTFVVPFKEKVDVMSVELMTLDIRTPEFFTKFGVPIVVDGVAQIKVLSDDPLSTALAAEMFLGKSRSEMNDIAHQMMQGHLRAVISTLPFEEIHANPESFAQTVQRLTSADLANMGIGVVSFTIREVRDPSGFLLELGKPQLAEVQKVAQLGQARARRDALIGTAEAEQLSSVRQSEAQRTARLAAIETERALSEAEAGRDRDQHARSASVARAKAEADLAYELENVRGREALIAAERTLELAQAEKRIALEEMEVRRIETELLHAVQKPAEADRRRASLLAESSRIARTADAEAEAEAILLRARAEAEALRIHGEAEADGLRCKGLAEAAGIEAQLLAEARGMAAKADAWKQYGDAALSQLLIDKLPQIAEAVAAPLGSIDRVVVMDGGAEHGSGVARFNRSLTEVLSQVPDVVEAVTGLDARAWLAPARALAGGLSAKAPVAPAVTAGPSPELAAGSARAMDVEPSEFPDSRNEGPPAGEEALPETSPTAEELVEVVDERA
ncbi:MAG: SPFH domain-containing protein [Polyangiales bacterium]